VYVKALLFLRYSGGVSLCQNFFKKKKGSHV
jgi:hypothetical protein